jgi:A/G-specific adenine glycosylase
VVLKINNKIPSDYTNFSAAIVAWYHVNKRTLPWRQTKDAYAIWLSEIILQQTRVAQGLPYYERFISDLPTINDFAKAPISKILKLWQGLGYYTRARNMHLAAQQVVALGGNFPADYRALIKIKGIGPYTAAAIASFAFNLPHAVVDGNVFRVLSRYFGVYAATNSAQGIKQFNELAGLLLPINMADIYNQAIMELGALVCKPQIPLCLDCPLQGTCFANTKNVTKQLPVKKAKALVKVRYFNFIMMHDANSLYLQHQTGKDIWQNLYVLPLFETEVATAASKVLTDVTIQKIIRNKNVTVTINEKKWLHKLTHQHIVAQFINCSLAKLTQHKKYISVNKDLLQEYAIPRLVEKYLMEQKWL